MNILDRVGNAVAGVFTTQERIGVLRSDVKELATELRDHEKRLIRLETLIEFAQRGPPRLPDR